jgi:predicted nucleic acid-binding protein
MRKQKIYIETTLFNHYFDEDRGIAHESTVALFKEIRAGKYEAFTSGAVIEELAEAATEKYEKMFSLIDKYSITVLSVNEEVENLADLCFGKCDTVKIPHRRSAYRSCRCI